MRKRRVLAALLALSLVVSGNGMTVLAAEPGAGEPAMTREETSGQTQEIDMPEAGSQTGENGTPGADGEAVTPETGGQTEESGAPETGEQTGESGTPDTGDQPGEGEAPEETEKPEESETPGTAEDPDAPKEDEATDPAEDQEQLADDETKVPDGEEEESDEDASAVTAYVSRMVTFTDDTGMNVTYDANASTRYHYVVTDHVLTAVQTETTDASGNPSYTNVAFTGNVELTQPEEAENQYTSVAANVFQGNSNITYVKLPAGVETVKAETFKNCTALKGVYLPASVKNIEDSAFESCTAMTQISVPKAVTEIGASAFKNDTKLHLVHIKDRDYCDLEAIGASAFEGCETLAEFCSDTGFVVPEKLNSIGDSAFKGCKSITKVDFSGTAVSSLGTNAFQGCTGLTDLNMGKNITEIPQYAFEGCRGLMSLIIQNQQGKTMTIDSYAFKGCYSLKQLVLPQSVTALANYAFQDCTNLGRVEVYNFSMTFAEEAFPKAKLATSGAKRLFIVDKPSNGDMSSGEIYARANSTVADYEYFDGSKGGKKQLYDCIIEGEDPVKKDGVITGGKIWVQTADGKKFRELNDGKGVAGDNTRYYIYYQANADFEFVPESLRCNGEPVQKDDKKRYYFTMPLGNVIITAKFAPKTTDRIDGKEITVEFSNGEPCDGGVSLKVGQTTRMFLIDVNGKAIPTSKIQSIVSSNTKVATVTKSGVITAVGTGGRAENETNITVFVNGEDGEKISVREKIVVVDADAASIALKATKYATQIIEITQSAETGIQTASLTKDNVANGSGGLEITLKANVYTAEQENISKALTWTTSNSKVAKVKTAKTDGKDPVNVVQIQAGCEGEATITATAVNAANRKVTQKFIVRVYQKSFKLATTAVSLNPQATTGGLIEVIGAYGQENVSDATITLYCEEKVPNSKETVLVPDTDFLITPQSGSDTSTKKFRIDCTSKSTVSDKTYNLKVSINNNKETLYPIKITVKRSVPKPTVKFNANKVKFNLFYRNGGVDAQGSPIEVRTDITKLGDTEISRVALEPLTQKESDTPFTENFEIDDEKTNLAAGQIFIKRSGTPFSYYNQKTAVVKGNLVIYYKGYEDSAATKVKVTMPTCTTAPSWALRTTKGTYRADIGRQNVSLEVYDKKSKTKEKVVLDQSKYIPEETRGEIEIGTGNLKIENGEIAVNFVPFSEKMVIRLKNPTEWDQDQKGNDRSLSFTYTVSTSAKKPTIKTKQSSVSLNLNYPEQEASFDLVSNLGGVTIADEQNFEAKSTRSNAAQIEKLDVKYEDGVGSVSIKDEYRETNPIKKGTYQFRCRVPQASIENVPEEGLKEVLLTVKVTDSRPGVKLGKGTMQLNKAVYRNNNAGSGTVNAQDDSVQDPNEPDPTPEYREIAKQTFKVSGKPEGYTLAPVGEGEDETTVAATKKYKGAEQYFDFSVEEDPAQNGEDVLRVSLKGETAPAKTYEFELTPRYTKAGVIPVSAKTVKFKVKVIDTTGISMTVSAKGKINLVNREGESTDKNGIVYTPALKNIVGEIEEVKIYDVSSGEESAYFDISMITEGKNAGKFYVTPKKIAKVSREADSAAYDYVQLDNNKTYTVKIWARVKGYAGNETSKYGVFTGSVRIKTAQVLPKVTLSRTALDVYLSTKNYDASFVVKPKAGSVGSIEDVYFAEKDEMANDSFALVKTPQEDGSMKVTVHLKEAVSFANGTNNNVKFYVKYKGQGENTSKTATGFTMKIKVN